MDGTNERKNAHLRNLVFIYLRLMTIFWKFWFTNFTNLTNITKVEKIHKNAPFACKRLEVLLM